MFCNTYNGKESEKEYVCVCAHTYVVCGQLFPTLVITWPVAHQVPLSWASPGKNTGVGCHALLQGIFLTQKRTCVSGIFCTGRWILYHCTTWEAHKYMYTRI